MNFPSQARYDYCVACACDFLEAYKINSYPVDLFGLIDKSPYALVPYSEIMKQFNCSIDYVNKTLKSDEGRTVYCDGIYTIAYNDVTKSRNRILFTLAHELGHIFLNHMIDFSITEMPKSSIEYDMPRYQYKLLEREANAFARNILVPIPLYYYLKSKDINSLQAHFGISHDAAIVRINLVSKDYECSKKLGLFDRFMRIYSAFIDKKKCHICGFGIIQKHGDYCPICGNKTLIWGDGDMSKFKTYATNENGRLIECIKCHNDELVGGYCHICGSPVENYCVDAIASYNYPEQCNNHAPLPSNARFCHICGGESLFSQKGILVDWSKELRQLEEEEKQAAEIQFMNIPDGIDEELPFDATSSASNKSDDSSNNDLIGITDVFGDIDEELPFN